MVDDVDSRAVHHRAPSLYDLTTLQRDANERIGWTAAQTLEAAQALYEAKLITYPRTESRHLPEDMRPHLADLLAAAPHPSADLALDHLRFYVRRRVAGGWRRGVLFVKELVPRRAIAWVARRMYGERYKAMRMSGVVWQSRNQHGVPDWTTIIRYWWRVGGSCEGLYAEASGEPSPVGKGSEAEFLTERAWGYSTRGGVTLEYHVAHPPWRVWDLSYVTLACDAGRLYGEPFGECLREPCSAFVAEGSRVVVHRGHRLVSEKQRHRRGAGGRQKS